MEEPPIFLEGAHLEFMPDLSQIQRQQIDLRNNEINTIFSEYIPRICKYLFLDNNRIHSDGLPFEWHEGIQKISLSKNYIFETEGIQWPIALTELNLSDNPLQIWPDGLPETLHELVLSYTYLKRVEPLPSSLRSVNVSSSHIHQLPTSFPESLTLADFHNNFLRNSRLPMEWGQSLRVLDLEKNYLTKIPENLPDSLEILRLSNNKIQEIPKNLPKHLKILLLNHNSIKKVHCENRAQPLQLLSLIDNELTESVGDYQEKYKLTYADHVREEENWIDDSYRTAAQKIRTLWKSYRLGKGLRTLVKTSRVKEELIQVSMHPHRAGRFEDISSDWGWGC